MAINDDQFVKLHLNAYHSGLMGAIYKEAGSNAWLLLSALACYMNEDRKCWPTQAQLAKDLGAHEKSIQRWTSELLAFRWKGKPIVTAEKRRSTKNPEHFYNRYTIHPEACFSIYNDKRNWNSEEDWEPEAESVEYRGRSVDELIQLLGGRGQK